MQTDAKPAAVHMPLRDVWAVFLVLLAAFHFVFHDLVPLPGGRMGHDYNFVLTNWLDGYIWFRNNGLAAPWFTPSFCAGQPFFPDPQSTFYSLPQFLYFILGPTSTAYAVMMICAALAFWGGYLLMRRAFGAGTVVATFVGALLMFNGFLPYRIAVGHVGYHGFALVPWIALLLLASYRNRLNEAAGAVLAGVLIAYWIHAGFGTLALAGGLAVALLGVAQALRGGSLLRFAARGVAAGAVGACLAAAKLSASFAYLANFPRTSYLLPGAASITDGVIAILSALFLPSQAVAEHNAARYTNVQWGLGPHEWAFSFGLATAVLALVLIVHLLYVKAWRPSVPSQRIGLWLLLALGLIWPLAFNTYDPDWNSFLKSLPILNTASTPTRWIVVYIPIIAVAIGLLLNSARWKPGLTMAAAGICVLLNVVQTATEPRDFYESQGYDARPIVIADRLIRAGTSTPAIDRLGTEAELNANGLLLKLASNNTFVAGMSQVFCYNPVFGYRLENFSPANLQPGDIFAQRGDNLNLKNPACYVYPHENSCAPGDTFKASQLSEAKSFASYKPYAFEMSNSQKNANLLSKSALVLVALFLIAWAATIIRTSIK